MPITEFIAGISGFDSLSPREKILLFSWYLHTHSGCRTFGNSEIRECFRQIDAEVPDVSVYLPRLADRKPPDLLREMGNYKLEGSIRRTFDEKYGNAASTIAVSKLLVDLPMSVPDISERAFLTETIDCYRVKAFRATTVMMWNLALDHLLHWIAKGTDRLNSFNSAIALRYPKKSDIVISTISDFSEMKEDEIIEVCKTSGILSKNTTEILREKLKRRNIAAHPSQVIITQAQADDVITDLVNNVILTLK